MTSVHVSVMPGEVLDFLALENKTVVVDCTFGGGGHTAAILERASRIKVIALDLDDDALARGAALQEKYGDRLFLCKRDFREFDGVLAERGISRVGGFVADLGISSDLLADAGRGFSFLADGPLDMRMDRSGPVTAADLVNGLRRDELADIFYRYGEERRSRRIADMIVEQRRRRRIETVGELAGLVRKAVGGGGKIHPATRTFQALRIAVNDEIGGLVTFLGKVPRWLAAGGRVAVISFHSLEDREVKYAFRKAETAGVLKVITKKPVTPSDEELDRNPRARSAKLRVAEKKAGEEEAV